MGATLANGGICPITGERVLSAEAVRNTLSLMYSCGMYDFSGQMAFHVSCVDCCKVGLVLNSKYFNILTFLKTILYV